MILDRSASSYCYWLVFPLRAGLEESGLFNHRSSHPVIGLDGLSFQIALATISCQFTKLKAFLG